MKERKGTLWEVRNVLSMTVRPNYTMEPLQPWRMSKRASNKTADGEDTPPSMGVCELAGDLERPVYLIKNESQGNKGTRSPLRCLSFMHHATARWDVWVKSLGRVTWTETQSASSALSY